MNRHCQVAWLFASVAATGLLASTQCLRAASTDDVDDVVVVTLRTAVTAPHDWVRIGDIATVADGDAEIRDQIVHLDIAEGADATSALSIPKEQVFYRIRIAGIDRRQFRLAGADSVEVTLEPGHRLEDDILTAAKERIRLNIPGDSRDISIQLDGRLTGVPARLPNNVEPRLEARLETTGIPLGHVQIAVAVVVHEQVIATIPVRLLVRLQQKVAMTTRRITAGEPFTEQCVFFAPVVSERLESYITDPRELAGQRAKHPLAAGQALSKGDLEASPSESPILVQQQRLVKMVAHLDGLQIEAMGEALQNGRSGELVRVRNIDSQIVVVGKVIDRSIVQVGN